MERPKANFVAEDLGTNGLQLVAYENKLYVVPAPDIEPMAIFDLQDVTEALGAEVSNGQAKIAALVGARGYTVQRFGNAKRYQAAQAVKCAEETLELALEVLPRFGTLTRAILSIQLRLSHIFDALASREECSLGDFDMERLAEERADVLVTLCCAAEEAGQDLMADALEKVSRDVARGVCGG